MIKKTMIQLEASKSDKEEDEEEENHYIKQSKLFEIIEPNQSMNNRGILTKFIPDSFNIKIKMK